MLSSKETKLKFIVINLHHISEREFSFATGITSAFGHLLRQKATLPEDLAKSGDDCRGA